MTNKIKLSPEQEAFALKIGASHVYVGHTEVKFISIVRGRYYQFADWTWFEWKNNPPEEMIEEIDFTQSQEVDWKALAKELFDAIDGLEIGYEHISDNDSDEVMYEWQFSASSLRKTEQALQRAKGAGL